MNNTYNFFEELKKNDRFKVEMVYNHLVNDIEMKLNIGETPVFEALVAGIAAKYVSKKYKDSICVDARVEDFIEGYKEE